MNFDFEFGRYGVFIWPAYAVTVAAFSVMIAEAVLSARRWKAQVDRQTLSQEAAKDRTRP